MSGYNATKSAYAPDRVPSNNVLPTKQVPSGKRPRRMRSLQGAAHYGNGQKGKKGPGAKVEYHDRRSAAPIFLQSELVVFSYFYEFIFPLTTF